MGIFELFILALGLSMDAFAVSVCKGLATKQPGFKPSLVCGLWFGGFQALMPLMGFYLGSLFLDAISSIDHWVAFGLLVLIGVNMLREALGQEEETADDDLSVKTMFIMAVATSIDALAVGLSLAMAGVRNIYSAVLLIGLTTFVLSALGVKVGAVFGSRYEKKAEIAGGVILILLGVKILLEHLGVLG